MLPRESTANIAAERIINAPNTSRRNPSHLKFQWLSISSSNGMYRIPIKQLLIKEPKRHKQYTTLSKGLINVRTLRLIAVC